MTWAFVVDSVPFTKAVRDGETSLGGSESACLGTARGLAKRGHAVHIFTTQLGMDAVGADAAGVVWHPIDAFWPMNQFIEWDVVCALRMSSLFASHPVYARLRLLWTQDLLVPGQMQAATMGIAWALDHIAYVSAYHRAQWEQLQPELAPLGWVTRNGYDPDDRPAESTKDFTRIIHISRPERGLGPLLAMWPALKAQRPDATLQICRYSSMYDQGPGSWTDVCASWDAQVQQVNAAVGGVTYLGELHKRQLYQAISDAAVMWYPGVSTFAETSCIAALEAQGCGTPFVGSYRGALPETVPSGTLIRGHHDSPEYQRQSIQAVIDLLDGCKANTFDYRRRQRDGRQHASQFTYAVLAQQWDTQAETWFAERYAAHKPAILRQLLYEDDHVAAKIVADDICADTIDGGLIQPSFNEANQAATFCDYVIAGKDQNAEHYGAAAIADPLSEIQFSGRFKAVNPWFEKSTHVLDVACGNGAFAIGLAMTYPEIRVHGLDYSAANIVRAREGAEKAGVADRVTFEQVTVYNFDQQELDVDFWTWAAPLEQRPFDGLFVGEFIEHVANYRAVIDGLEAVLSDGATVVYTCPHGSCADLVPRNMPLRRGHVHRFHHDDVHAVWGTKAGFGVDYFAGGFTERGVPIGNWLIRYTKQAGRPCGDRPLADRIHRTRPLQRVSVGIIAKDAEQDLARCLASVYPMADEIVVADTGSTDTTRAIAAAYGPKVRLIDLPPVTDDPDGFAGTRNAVLRQCSGEWFLWIDCDEQLHGAPWLRRYLDGTTFNGFVLRQTHLYLDGPPTWDIPVRLFRNTGQVQFYGCVHEQPQDGHPNGDIYPTLEVLDLRIAHTGYLTAEGRETKRVERNLPLLMRDAKRFPDRVLGKVLLLREAVIQADAIRASARGELTPKAQQGYVHALRLFIDHFDDPTHKYHKLARPWYEAALQHLGIGWEQEIALAGRRGGMEGRHAEPQCVWVRDSAEYARVMQFKVESVIKGMAPVTFLTDPDDLAPPVDVPQEAMRA